MKAYSYSRFSSSAQRQGTSIDRQQALAIKWCEDNKITLSDDTFADEAVSGYRGRNRKFGALANFISRVKSGEIAKGSYLILEHLDRLTREHPWAAAQLLQDLVKIGIVVVTLKPEPKRYDGKSGAIDLLQAILYMDNAHNESVNKSNYGKDKWAKRFVKARETGHHIGSRVSNWLTLDKLTGKYYINEHAFAVGRIFELCLQGLGSTAISQTLNAEGYRTLNKGDRWGTSAVLTILKNRAAVGELALKDGGEPIPDYFPAVVNVETFDAAKNMVRVRKTGKITKQSADFNVWRKLVVCGACGSAMNIIHRTKFRYLMCANRRYGACEGSKNVRLDESEDVLMAMLLHLDAMSLVMPDPDRLNRELQAAEGRLLTERESLVVHAKRLEQHPESETTFNLVLQSEGKIKALKADIERLTDELSSGEKLNWQQIRAKIDLTDKPTRRRVNAFLHRLGVQVRIAEGYLLVQRDVAVAMFAVEKNRIGYIALDNDMSEPWEPEEMPEGLVLTGGVGEAPRLQQANELAAGVKRRLTKGGIGGSAVGTLTVPNGRGTRRARDTSPD